MPSMNCAILWDTECLVFAPILRFPLSLCANYLTPFKRLPFLHDKLQNPRLTPQLTNKCRVANISRQ